MMPFDDNNRGALWIKTDKTKESQPDCSGQCTIDGIEYWVHMWGQKPDPEHPTRPRFTMKFHMKDEQKKITPEGRTNGLASMKETMATLGGYEPGLDDDIPF